jgi:CTP synthase
MAKIDPYLNQDAGTMSPYEHGECFVLDDGMEADLDLGNYERFLERSLTMDSAITSGQIYRSVLDAERKGTYLGKTVQVVPHVTQEICDRLKRLVHSEKAAAVIEIGGTVGDIESDIFYCALRKLHREEGRTAFCHVHVSVILKTQGGELKTKPTQQSVQELNKRGIIPDILCLRLPNGVTHLTQADKTKLYHSCGHSFLLLSPTCHSVYAVPKIFHDQGILDYFGMDLKNSSLLGPFNAIAQGERHPGRVVKVVGKYFHRDQIGHVVDAADAYLSLRHALDHAALNAWGDGSLPTLEFIDAEDVLDPHFEWLGKSPAEAIILTGGFGSRAYDGFIRAAIEGLEAKIPTLGICLGFQLMVVGLARKAGWLDADTKERNGETSFPVIDLHHESLGTHAKGGTLRRGAHLVRSINAEMGSVIPTMEERFRHRYHVNPDFLPAFPHQVQWDGEVEDLPGVPTRLRVKNHPFFWGTQAHCELNSRPSTPSPYFVQLLQAMVK